MQKLNMNDWRRIFQEKIEEEKPKDVWSLKMYQQLDYYLDSGWTKVLEDQAHASFTCSQCYHTWSSHHVVILFHMCRNPFDRHGSVWMRVFRQQCNNCPSQKYEEPQFTETDVSNIIRRLILNIREKCYGEHVDRSELSEVVWGHTGPHKQQYCEACKLGIHKWRHQSSKGTQHHEKAQRPGHLGIPEEPKTQVQQPSDSSCPVSSCACCLRLILTFILIYIVYLVWQNRG